MKENEVQELDWQTVPSLLLLLEAATDKTKQQLPALKKNETKVGQVAGHLMFEWIPTELHFKQQKEISN